MVKKEKKLATSDGAAQEIDREGEGGREEGGMASTTTTAAAVLRRHKKKWQVTPPMPPMPQLPPREEGEGERPMDREHLMTDKQPEHGN